MNQPTELLKIAIKLIPSVGDIVAKKLIAYCGSLEAVFNEKEKSLAKIPGIGTLIASSISKSLKSKDIFVIAEKEVEFNTKFGVKTIFFLDQDYPKRLIHCEDSPITIFTLGNCNYNSTKIISIVGTRKATDYGKDFCKQLITDFKNSGIEIIIVSGLAYGIDIAAHKAALDENISTVGVLAHGLDNIYPAAHRKFAKQMILNGGLITEFLTNTTPDKPNFVKRNRIIAGLADATIVVESDRKGGALITADIANSYNRDVFALPGRKSDKYSSGSNQLIKTNRAILAESATDIATFLGWESNIDKEATQSSFFTDFEPDELSIALLLEKEGNLPIDMLALLAKMPVSKVSATLLGMEFKSIVKCLPGKVFKLCMSLPKS
jgi:DNA processing protein